MVSRIFAPAGVGLALVLLTVAPLRAEDADDGTADMTFEQKLIHQLMTGLGATNGTDKGITYRERSPLVLPKQYELPAPQANANAALAPNWPKDPDEQERRAAALAAKQPGVSADQQARPLMPAEIAKGRTAPGRQRATSGQTGDDAARKLMPNELGYRGGLFGSILTPQQPESATFSGEPTRDTLTAPPPGYQTPSPNFAYGVGQRYMRDQVKQAPSGEDWSRPQR